MSHRPIFRKASRLAAVTAVAAGALVALAPSAFADTSNASANAVNLTLIPITSGLETASNSGGANVINGDSPALSVLGTQSDITAGLLQQTATALNIGASSACAGLVGNGSTIQVGDAGICSLSSLGEDGGITIGGLGKLGVIDANAIVAECNDTAGGTPQVLVQLLGANLLAGAIKLPVNPTVDQSILGIIKLNVQSTPQPGEIQTTALEIPAIGLSIGTVTCGPNAITSPTSVFPLKSLPIVFGTAAVLIAGGVVWYRRRSRRLSGV